MIKIIVKIIRTLSMEVKNRGVYFTLLMMASQITAMLRGFFYKLLYFRNVYSTIFSMQSNSKIDIFNKKAKVKIGKFVFIRKNASIRMDFDGKLDIGEKVFINDNCNINCVNKIIIGKFTKIAPNVSINDHDHNYKNFSKEHLIKGEIIIGNNVWIGSNVVILMNTTIGDNAVIAAGSIVKGNVPSNTVYMNKREKIIKNNLFQVINN
jgi:acetyltransferase-like isoleucine patch superfamily enzyme